MIDTTETDDEIAARLWASVAKLAATRTGPATVRPIDIMAGLGADLEAIEKVTENRPADYAAIRKGNNARMPVVAKGKADRITIERAGDILGLATRTVQKMSQRGQLPGAALMGRRWTYDEDKLHGYVRNQERAVWLGRSKHRQGVIGKTVSSTVASRSTAKPTDDLYSRVIQKSRDAVAQRKKKNL
jgi:hypothetical protein